MPSSYMTSNPPTASAPSSPEKRSTTAILKNLVTPRSRRGSQQANLANTAPIMKPGVPYLELRKDTFEPLAPPNPPFLDTYSRKSAEKTKNLFGTSGKGAHRKSMSSANFLGESASSVRAKKESHRHSGIFHLSRATESTRDGSPEPKPKQSKPRSTVDFSMFQSKARDRSPPNGDRKGSPVDVNNNRPTSSRSNYGLGLGRLTGKRDTNPENQAAVTARPATSLAISHPPASPEASPYRTPVTPAFAGWQSPAVPQSHFTPREQKPTSYLQQQRTSHYAAVESRQTPASQGSDSSSGLSHHSPRQSVDHYHKGSIKRTNTDPISLYTPNAYTPSSQRNFRGQGFEVGLKARPKSAYYAPAPGSGFGGAGDATGGRRISGNRGSWDSTGNSTTDDGRTSVSSGRDSVTSAGSKQGSDSGKTDIDKAFEALLDNRGVAPNMRAKLRNLDPRVKQHFINNESELEKLGGPPRSPAGTTTIGPGNNTNHTISGVSGLFSRRPQTTHGHKLSISNIAPGDLGGLEVPFAPAAAEADAPKAKKARPRSRTFALVKEKDKDKEKDKGLGVSPKKQKPLAFDSPTQPSTAPMKPTMRIKNTLLGQPIITVLANESSPLKQPRDAVNAESFVTFLQLASAPSRRQGSRMKDVEVNKLHKLRLYLRNERLKWVEDFIVLGGMNGIIDVVYRCLDIEWREEHEDAILHELLLCLKALTTATKALERLALIETELFTRLIDLVFDEERKGPSEFTTRGLVFSILFAYLEAAPATEFDAAGNEHDDYREARARRILSLLSDKAPRESKRQIEFIERIHTKRPYKRWCKEVTSVTKEVFWIFLHHGNIITPPETEAYAEGETYQGRHFPHERPPVPAAPYVGGVEWEATTYLSIHIDLLNGIIASIETKEDRNELREDLRNSGWEKVMGGMLRTCKERLHGCSAVHDGLKTWVSAALEDQWDASVVRYGPPKGRGGGSVGLVKQSEQDGREDEKGRNGGQGSPVKKSQPPQVPLELPSLNLASRVEADGWMF